MENEPFPASSISAFAGGDFYWAIFTGLSIAMQTNRRKYHRIASTGAPCTMKFRGHEFDVKLVDESIEGIRVGDLKLTHLFRDEPVEVVCNGQVIHGITRSTSCTANDLYQVGIQREQSESVLESNPVSGTAPVLLGHFIRFHGRWIFCSILSPVGSMQVRIRLLDGKQFVIRRNQVFQLNETERRAMLEDSEEFEEAVEFYTLMAPEISFADIDTVIKYEFQQMRR